MIFGKIVKGLNYRIRPAAYVVIKESDGKIAIVKGKSGYFLPGGGSLNDESPLETIIRELREELGRSVEIIAEIGQSTQYVSVGDEHYKMLASFYWTRFTSKQIARAEHELFWLREKEAVKNLYHECHKWAINQDTKLFDSSGRQ